MDARGIPASSVLRAKGEAARARRDVGRWGSVALNANDFFIVRGFADYKLVEKPPSCLTAELLKSARIRGVCKNAAEG